MLNDYMNDQINSIRAEALIWHVDYAIPPD